MAGTLPEEKAALWFRSLPAAEEALRVVSWDPGGEKVQFGAARGTNPCASPHASRERPGAMRVQVKVNTDPHPPLHPLPGATGNSQPRVPRAGFTAGAELNRKFWRIGEGGRPRLLGTLGKEVSLAS